MWAKAVWGYAKQPLIGVQPCNHPNEKIIKATWRGTNASLAGHGKTVMVIR